MSERFSQRGVTIRRRGFTLVELLVVVTIIVVLLGLVSGVGFVVIQNQKVTVTRGVVSALDRALDEYMQQNGGNIPSMNFVGGLPEDYVGVPGPDVAATDANYFRVYPIAGGPRRYPIRPDAAVFLRQAMGYGQVQSIVSGMGEAFLRLTTTPDGATDVSGLMNQWNRDTDVTPSVMDAWADLAWKSPWRLMEETGNASIPGAPESLQSLVIYVHPENKLAQAIYGKCEAGRPYFMSPGPDGFYGLWTESPRIIQHYGLKMEGGDVSEFKQRTARKAREDNVYSGPVKWDFELEGDVLSLWP